MYEERDYDDLAFNKGRLEEIIDILNEAKELLYGTDFVGKASLENCIDDAISEAADDESDIDEAMTEEARKEEAEELREYWRSVI